MNTHCQPLPAQVAEELLQVVTRAICERPADNAPQRESRTRQMIHAVMGFEPRDGLEYMLATIAFGHFQVILDSMHDLLHGQSDTLKAKNKTTIVALDRMMLEMFKELRVVRRRPIAFPAAESADDTDDARRPAAPSPIAAAVEAAMPKAVPVAPAPIAGGIVSEAVARMPAAVGSAAIPPTGTVQPRHDGAPSDAARPDGTSPGFAALAQAMIALTAAGAGESGPAQGAPAVPASSLVVPLADTRSSAPTPEPFAKDISGFLTPAAAEGDTGTFEEHIAAFEAAYAATMEVQAEARALELANTEEASGD